MKRRESLKLIATGAIAGGTLAAGCTTTDKKPEVNTGDAKFALDRNPDELKNEKRILAMDKFKDQIGPAFDRKIIIYARNGRMVEGGQHICLALKILHNGLAHERIRGCVDHFLDRHQLGHIGEMHVTGAVNRTHAANANHLLNRIAVDKSDACLKLTGNTRVLVTLVVR